MPQKKQIHFLFYSITLAILFTSTILPINIHLAFNNISTPTQIKVELLLKFLFTLFLSGLIYFVIHAFRRLRDRNTAYLNWFKHASIFFCIFFALLLLTYPGNWVWDEFGVLNVVRDFSFASWQHFYTNIFYTFCLFLFPSAISIVMVQIIVISLISGKIASVFARKIKGVLPQLCLYIPFLLPPVLFHNLYPLRMTLFTYLLLFVIVQIYESYSRRQQIRQLFAADYFSFVKVSIILAILAFWRPEGIIYLMLVPVALYTFCFQKSKKIKYTQLCLFLVPLIAALSFGYLITKKTSDPSYSLTAIVNPLSIIINKPLKSPISSEHLASIDKVLDINIVRSYPDPENITSYWNGAARSNSKQYLDEALHSYIQLVISNPDDFLAARYQTFLATNGLGKHPPPVAIDTMTAEKNPNTVIDNESRLFLKKNAFIHPINYDVKKITTNSLLMLENGKVSFLGKLLWSLLPSMMALIIASCYLFFRKRWTLLLIPISILASSLLVFLTAPASFFMYYLPLYMSGYICITYSLVSCFPPQRQKHKKLDARMNQNAHTIH